MKLITVKIIFALLFGTILPTGFAFAQQEEIGFFFNDDLQDALHKDYFLVVDNKKIPFHMSQYAIWNTVLVRQKGYQSEIENIYYCNEKIQNLSLCDLTSASSGKDQIKKGAMLFIHEDKINKYLTTIAKDIEAEPQNGRLRMTSEGKLQIVQKSKDGYYLNEEGSLGQILNAFKTNPSEKNIPLITHFVEPEISTDNIQALGIKEKIGEGQSNFRGSPNNRIFNIKLATSKFDGVLIKPGEEFSFVKTLGPVDEKSGYKEELVIKKNETIPEFGGGVCQVSTTMFRAALNSGFEIVERRNHAYPVQYYSPQGTDATVYIPRPDLRYLNNTSAYILIQSSIIGTILKFEIYGTSDGRQVELDGPRVTERTEDGKMRTILYQIVKDESGNEIRKATFKSFYDNPDNYHHEPLLTEKPKDWSKSEWKDYKRKHGL